MATPSKPSYDPLLNPDPSSPDPEEDHLISPVRSMSDSIRQISTILCLTSEEIQHLIEQMKLPDSGVKLSIVINNGKRYHNCFDSSEAVKWIEMRLSYSRMAAVLLGNQMISLKLIQCIDIPYLFDDCGLRCFFVDKSQSRNSSSGLKTIRKYVTGVFGKLLTTGEAITDVDSHSQETTVTWQFSSSGIKLFCSTVQEGSTDIYFQHNPMYIKLRENGDLFIRAITEKCLILLPLSSAVEYQIPTRKDIESHIFFPAGMGEQMDEYRSINGSIIKLRNKYIQTREGFPDRRKVVRIFEHVFLTEHKQSLRIIHISGPLTNLSASTIDPAPWVDLVGEIAPAEEVSWPVGVSRAEHEMFLRKYSENIPILEQLLVKVQRSIRRKTLTISTATYIKALCVRATEAIAKTNPHLVNCLKDPTELDMLKRSVISYVTSYAYERLFSVFRFNSLLQDQRIDKIINSLAINDPGQLGLRQELNCQIPDSVSIMDQFCDYTTPLEKIDCLKRCTDSIILTIERHLQETQEGDTHEAIGADDILPFVIFAIIKAKPKFCHANIYFILAFEEDVEMYADYGFQFTTFRAAIDHLMTHDFSEELKRQEPSAAKSSLFSRRMSMASSTQ